MPIVINRRHTWGQYADEEHRAHATADPVPSTGDWTAQSGVFIHHRGPGDAGDLVSEEDCRRDIAAVYEGHLADEEQNYDDIAYNFVVCLHGHIYEGRGYERGEANGNSYVDGVGRNAGFYSVLGLMRSDNLATEEMLTSMRGLIAHLRQSAPKKAGPKILRHSDGFPTECPGNLAMYARQGSTIDPSAPWTGLGDVHVHRVQRWVNEAYASAPGYVPCPEYGRTGWHTVLSLTQALQHELGISPTVQNFGPGTFEAVRRLNRMPSSAEPSRGLLGVVNGALWCKGYWASTSLIVWDRDSENALARVYADMGLPYENETVRRAMWPHVLKGLLRMDQFRQVPGGDGHIRAIQQRLNSRYVAEVGIPAMGLVPCDGVYSRDVQQGFMMALQYEIGIAPAAINGYFGGGTQEALRGVGSGRLTGNLRYLFRAACYFNSPTYGAQGVLAYRPEDIGTDTETASHTAWLTTFQKFSQLPASGKNDYATWAQLLVSSGDVTRPASGCDCITTITPERGRRLMAAGYRIVGRYLDEHLTPDDPDYRGKALKPGEPQDIIDAGLRFFPIFQYNGTLLENFTYAKGYDQGGKAHQKAVEHGIGAGTCIYFGVDYDATDEEIDSHIVPYFKGVRARLTELGGRYTFGPYGSRNVCARVTRECAARWSFVSGMSWGFSGNLGFPLPVNWSFNQIREFEFETGWGLDHNIWRDGGDPGVSALTLSARSGTRSRR